MTKGWEICKKCGLTELVKNGKQDGHRGISARVVVLYLEERKQSIVLTLS